MTTFRRIVLLFATVLTAAAAVFAPNAFGVTRGAWFGEQVGPATQVVSVDSQGSAAIVRQWQRGPAGWDRVGPDIGAFIGTNGVAPAAVEGVPATPAGVYGLDSVFGTASPPGGGLPYRTVGANDWWDGDIHSATYNTHQVCAPGTCRFDQAQSERLAIPEYKYAVVMGVNAARIPGRGSAFFMHVTDGGPTQGCVTMGESSLLRIIRWLEPGAVIVIR